jgi:hypothetical protein
VREERAPGVGERCAPLAPCEDGLPEIVLEERDATAERRLREVQRIRRPREAPEPHDRDERLDDREIHIISFTH